MNNQRFEVIYDLLKKGHKIVLKHEKWCLVDRSGDYSTEITLDELNYLIRNRFVVLDTSCFRERGTL